MPVFVYKALDNKGKILSGTKNADSSASVIKELQSQGYFPTSVVESDNGAGSTAVKIPGVSAKKTVIAAKKGGKIKLPILVGFIQQLSTLIGAGVQVADALTLLSNQTFDPILKYGLEEVVSSVKKGDSMSEAMRKQGKVFHVTLVNLVAAGEASGHLESVLDEYGKYLHRQDALVKRLKTMLIYPSFVVTLSLVALIGLMVFVVPKFVGFLKEMNVELPLPTRILITASALFQTPYFIAGLLVTIVAIVVSLKVFLSTDKGKNWWSKLRVKVPMVGTMTFYVIVARFSITLATLIKSGVPVLQALHAARDTVENRMIAAEIDRIIYKIEHGGAFGETVAEGGVFPPLMIQLIKIGEEVGKLGVVLDRVGNYYEREAEIYSQRMLSLLEPVVILFMGFVVGGLAVSVLLPLIKGIGGAKLG